MALQLHQVDYDSYFASFAARLRLEMAHMSPNVETFLGRNVATIYYQVGYGQVAETDHITLASESSTAANRAPVYEGETRVQAGEDEGMLVNYGVLKNFQKTPAFPVGLNAPTRHSEKACWDAIQSKFLVGIRADNFLQPHLHDHPEDKAQFKGKMLKAKVLWVYTEREPCGPDNANCTRLLEDILEKHGIHGQGTPVYYSFYWPDTRNFAAGPPVTAEEVAAYARTYRKFGTAAVRVLDQWLNAQTQFPAPDPKSGMALLRTVKTQGPKIEKGMGKPVGYKPY
jgi:hypothetical protein